MAACCGRTRPELRRLRARLSLLTTVSLPLLTVIPRFHPVKGGRSAPTLSLVDAGGHAHRAPNPLDAGVVGVSLSLQNPPPPHLASLHVTAISSCSRTASRKPRASARLENSLRRSIPTVSTNGTTYFRPERYTPRWRVRRSLKLRGSSVCAASVRASSSAAVAASTRSRSETILLSSSDSSSLLGNSAASSASTFRRSSSCST